MLLQTKQSWSVWLHGTNVAGDLHAELVLRRQAGELHGSGATAIFEQERRAAAPLTSRAHLATFDQGAPDTDVSATVGSDGQS